MPELDVSTLDMSGMQTGFSGLTSGMSAVTSSLQSLGVINSETAQALTVASSALGAATGVLGIAQLLQARVVAKTAQETAVAGALTAVNLTNPVGWTNIAIATACMGVASIAIYTATTRIKSDLSTASGRASATRQVQEAMA